MGWVRAPKSASIIKTLIEDYYTNARENQVVPQNDVDLMNRVNADLMMENNPI